MTNNKYVPPEFDKQAFHCPNCEVYAHQDWDNGVYRDNIFSNTGDWENTCYRCKCHSCEKFSYWFNEKLIYPKMRGVETANADMPNNCKEIYNEAADIVSDSPRAAVALLRLCLQELMPHIGGDGKNINADIRKLVQEGLNKKIQQALDTCRVIGNEAVHPGEIQINDKPEYAYSLFKLLNFIVEQCITRPREQKELFDSLPADKRKAIVQQDGTEKENI